MVSCLCQRAPVWLAVIVVLAACGQEPETTAAPATAEEGITPTGDAADARARLSEDPQALREAMRDPERREEVIQAMREQRAETPDEVRTQLRERMRERREEILSRQGDGERGADPRTRRALTRGSWWEDESIAADLELGPAQTQAIAAAHSTLDRTRIQSRQDRAGSQRELLSAFGQADRERVKALLEQRSNAAVELARAEAQWLSTLIEQLDDQQLETLTQQYPQILLGRL